MDEAEFGAFARTFQRFLEVMSEFAGPEEGVPLKAVLAEHLDSDAQRLPVVADRFLPFEHVNVQVAVDALLAQPGRSHEADGPGSARPCVQAGVYLLRDQGVPVVLLLRGPNEHGPHQTVSVEVLAQERLHAERLVAEVRRLSVQRSVFRNQVLSFAAGPFGEQTAGPIAFQPRPQLADRP